MPQTEPCESTDTHTALAGHVRVGGTEERRPETEAEGERGEKREAMQGEKGSGDSAVKVVSESDINHYYSRPPDWALSLCVT